MSSYNQTKSIMEELKLKVKAASSSPNKKVFVVVLEGTESEFDEIRRLGGIEIEDTNTLSNLSGILPSINKKSDLNNIKSSSTYVTENQLNKRIYVSTGTVVTESDVAKLSEEINEIVLKERGMITPLAKDLAKRRGIKIVKVKP